MMFFHLIDSAISTIWFNLRKQAANLSFVPFEMERLLRLNHGDVFPWSSKPLLIFLLVWFRVEYRKSPFLFFFFRSPTLKSEWLLLRMSAIRCSYMSKKHSYQLAVNALFVLYLFMDTLYSLLIVQIYTTQNCK